MTKEPLPEPFNHFWTLQKKPSITKQHKRSKGNYSHEWQEFLNAVNCSVKKDLKKKIIKE